MSEPPIQIDTIRLSYEMKERPDEEGATMRAVVGVSGGTEFVVSPESATFTKQIPGGGQVMWGSSSRAQMEVNVSKVLQGHNVTAPDLPQALEVAREVWGKATVLVPNDEPFERAFVNRADLCRDFEEVSHIEAVLRTFAPMKSKGRMSSRLFRDTSRDGALTLTRGNASRGGTLYDKHGEVAARPPKPPSARNPVGLDELRAYREAQASHAKHLAMAEGRLRYEARIRVDPLRNGGIHVVQDLRALEGEPKLAHLRRSVFDWCGYSRSVEGRDVIVATVQDAVELSPSEKLSVLGYLMVESSGASVDAFGLSRNTVSKYRRIATELGLVLGDGAIPEGALELILDYEAGHLRVA